MKHLKLFEEWSSSPIQFGTAEITDGTRIDSIDFQESEYFKTFLNVMKDVKFSCNGKEMKFEVLGSFNNAKGASVDKDSLDPNEDEDYVQYLYSWNGEYWVGEKIWQEDEEELVSVGSMSPVEFVHALYSDKVISKHDLDHCATALSKFDHIVKTRARKYDI